MLTQARLKELLHYDPGSGTWRWNLAKGRGVGVAGSLVRRRRQIKIDGQKYRASRLAFFYMTGNWPPHVIDHRDGDTSNDSWSNLRSATRSQNNGNMRRKSNNQVGMKGVVPGHKGKFVAYIRFNGKGENLGTFATAAEAHAAYVAAAKDHFGEFARFA